MVIFLVYPSMYPALDSHAQSSLTPRQLGGAFRTGTHDRRGSTALIIASHATSQANLAKRKIVECILPDRFGRKREQNVTVADGIEAMNRACHRSVDLRASWVSESRSIFRLMTSAVTVVFPPAGSAEGASLCGVTLMTSRGCMRCPVSLSRKPRMTLPDLSMMTPSALTTVTTSTFTVAADARPFLAAIRELTGRALRRAVFLKVPCDRPTFAATRGYCIPPRGPRRACVRNQRARARGMRRLGRDGRVIRRFVALS
jgi:hypothetical protein